MTTQMQKTCKAQSAERPFALGEYWNSLLTKHGLPPRALTPRERGQLKKLADRLGPLTNEVIAWVMSPMNWWTFAEAAATAADLTAFPERPSIPFLLAHCQVAVPLQLIAADEKKQKPETKAGPKMKMLTRKPVPQPATPDDLPMTPEEMAAAYNECLE